MRPSALFLLSVGACNAPLPTGPAPTAVDPASTVEGMSVQVSILGDGFAVKRDVDFQNDSLAVDARFAAWLGDTELENVTYVDEHTLSATVPDSLQPGEHDLKVQVPGGLVGVLAGAFEVVPRTANNLPPQAALSVSPGAVEVGALVSADASASSDDVDPLSALSFTWDFGDDEGVIEGGPTASHTYSAAGIYRIWVHVADTAGLGSYAFFDLLVPLAGRIITVTSADDSVDPVPAGSLREALSLAASTLGRDVVLVPAGMVIKLAAALTIDASMHGVAVVGDGATLDGSGLGGSASCLTVEGSVVVVAGFEIMGCPSYGVDFASGSGHLLTRCRLHDSNDGVGVGSLNTIVGPLNDISSTGGSGFGVEASAPLVVVGNRIHDNRKSGIDLNDAGAGASTVQRNIIFANGTDGVSVGVHAANHVIRLNTVYGNQGYGILLAQTSTGSHIVDNILAGNASAGLRANASDNTAELDFNDYFGNSGGACDGCTVGSHDLQVDPGFVDAAGGDFRLAPDSLLSDAGLDVGVDVNGPAPGLFNGLAPDIGACETPSP